MATRSELVTLITADNTQFKATIKNSSDAVKQFSTSTQKQASLTKDILSEVGKGLAGLSAITFLKTGYESLDRLTASADKLGISAENFQFLEYAAKRSDISVESLEQSMRRLNLSISRGDSTKALADSFKELGLSASKLQSMGIDESFYTIVEALQKLPKDRQIDIGTQLFGRNFQNMAELTANNIEDLRKAFEEAGGAVDVSGFDKLDKRVDDLTTKWTRFARTAFLSLGGPLLSAAETLMAVLSPPNYGNNAGSINSQISTGLGRGNAALGAIGAAGQRINQGTFTGPSNAGLGQIFPKLNSLTDSLTKLFSGATNNSALSAGKSGELAANSLNRLADASSAAGGALKVLANQDLKSVLGLSPQSGQDYLNSILTPPKQVKDDYFTQLAQDLQANISSGSNGFSRSNNMTLLNELKQRSSEIIPGQGESNSGMLDAVRLLEDKLLKVQNNIPDKVVIELKYDQDGIIKAFVNSTTYAAVTSNIVAQTAATEAASTIATGG